LQKIEVRLPAPAGAAGWYPLARATEFLGQPVWALTDVLGVDGAELTSEAPETGGQAAVTPSGAVDSLTSKAASGNDPREYTVGLTTPGAYGVTASAEPLAWAVGTVRAGDVVFVEEIPGLVVMADALAYLRGRRRSRCSWASRRPSGAATRSPVSRSSTK
jgi:hypothetical protein